MRLRSPYTLFTRKISHGSTWHVSWYDAQGARHTKALMAISPQLKDRGRTLAAREALRIVTAAARRIPTLQEYAGTFYGWEDSAWIKRQHAKGRSFNQQWAQSLQAMLENHVFPKWGRTRLDALNRVAIENWLVGLALSNQSKNHMLYALRTILREAESEGILSRNPLEHVEPMGKGGRKRDVFALEELRLLFPATTEGLLAVWKHPKYAALFLTMATTGIREGEARALQWRHVLPSGWLVVERAVKVNNVIGPLKKRERTGEPRVAALPARAREVLSWWREKSPCTAPDDLVFFGDRADHPLNRRTLGDVFRRALDGRKSEQPRIRREGRYLTPHSLRHTYNTAVRRVIPADALLALMGHRDSRMSELYDHPEIADRIRALEAVRPQIEGALAW